MSAICPARMGECLHSELTADDMARLEMLEREIMILSGEIDEPDDEDDGLADPA